MQDAKPGVSGDFRTASVRAPDLQGPQEQIQLHQVAELGDMGQPGPQPEGEHVPLSMADYFLRGPRSRGEGERQGRGVRLPAGTKGCGGRGSRAWVGCRRPRAISCLCQGRSELTDLPSAPNKYLFYYYLEKRLPLDKSGTNILPP